MQKRLSTNTALSIGVQQENLIFRPKVGGGLLFNRLSYTNYNLYARLEHNSLNRNIFPTEGTRLSLELKGFRNGGYEVSGLNPEVGLNGDSLFSFKPYTKLSLRAERLLPLSSRASLKTSTFAGWVTSPDNTFGDFFLVGGARSPDPALNPTLWIEYQPSCCSGGSWGRHRLSALLSAQYILLVGCKCQLF